MKPPESNIAQEIGPNIFDASFRCLFSLEGFSMPKTFLSIKIYIVDLRHY